MTQETAAKAAPAPDQVKLALERTFLAHERTLMAWVRTATSLITFGFALYKFFFYLHQEKPPTHGEQFFGARTYGLCMIGIGVFTLVIATWQHRQQMKPLRAQYPEAPLSLSLVLAALIASLGILAFIAAILRQ
jgi:putative membrane protein